MLRTRLNFLLGAAALGGLVLSISPAAAQAVQTETLHVEALVGDVCTVTSASLNFGPYNGGFSAVTASGDIQIECVAETNLQVALDGGLHGSNGGGQRTLENGSSTLAYTLFTDAPNGDSWDTDEAVPATITGTGSVPVHGSIAPSQDLGSPGLYTDEVTITLIF